MPVNALTFSAHGKKGHDDSVFNSVPSRSNLVQTRCCIDWLSVRSDVTRDSKGSRTMHPVAAAAIALLGASNPISVTNSQTLTSTIYADHWEKHLPRNWVASYNISYLSSVQVTMVEYGGKKARCRYVFGNLTLTRHFTYDGLHQARPYRIMHLQSGIRSWVRVPPLAPVEARGSCAEVLAREIVPAAANANALGVWKATVDDDDVTVRRFLKLGTASANLRAYSNDQ